MQHDLPTLAILALAGLLAVNGEVELVVKDKALELEVAGGAAAPQLRHLEAEVLEHRPAAGHPVDPVGGREAQEHAAHEPGLERELARVPVGPCQDQHAQHVSGGNNLEAPGHEFAPACLFPLGSFAKRVHLPRNRRHGANHTGDPCHGQLRRRQQRQFARGGRRRGQQLQAAEVPAQRCHGRCGPVDRRRGAEEEVGVEIVLRGGVCGGCQGRVDVEEAAHVMAVPVRAAVEVERRGRSMQ
mmetsp:Transcript_37182/g.100636  ORF Transcript_37182/g.100636 Transcript_37182/m.100636 type:complete len:242 (-) Transcript_37182:148-873(-)